jgi:hypothetical protein
MPDADMCRPAYLEGIEAGFVRGYMQARQDAGVPILQAARDGAAAAARYGHERLVTEVLDRFAEVAPDSVSDVVLRERV